MGENEFQRIWTVSEFFKSFGRDQSKDLIPLRKPPYQRNYEWEEKHVKALLDDLLKFKDEDSSDYRLGCIILYDRINANDHREEDDNEKNDKKYRFDVIDGQQRLVTLQLIREVLVESENLTEVDKVINLTEVDKAIKEFNADANEVTLNAKKWIKRWFVDHGDDWVCKLVGGDKDKPEKNIQIAVLVVDDLEEAFQLFDTQNGPGKVLTIHDYLKAHHVGCMSQSKRKEAERDELFDIWKKEEDSEKIEDTLNNLFKIEKWSRLDSRTKLDIDNMSCFYGVKGSEPKYEYQKRILLQKEPYEIPSLKEPYEIGRSFKAGEEFFRMFKHFHKMKEGIIEEDIQESLLKKRLDGVASMDYCATLFLRAAMLYINRFGSEDWKRDKNVLLAWSSLPRCIYKSLPLSAIDKWACGKEIKGREKSKGRMFLSMFCSTEPDEFLRDMKSDVIDIVEKKESDKKDWPNDNKGGYEKLRKDIKGLLG